MITPAISSPTVAIRVFAVAQGILPSSVAELGATSKNHETINAAGKPMSPRISTASTAESLKPSRGKAMSANSSRANIAAQ
jgi:hypothetical protein